MKKLLACLMVSFTSFASNFELEEITSITFPETTREFLGNIPHEILDKIVVQFPNLKTLFLRNNLHSVSASNPPSGFNPTSFREITTVGSSNNQLTGSIPESIGFLTRLETLELSGHTLSGAIPDSIGQLINLKILVLSNNHLTGLIPDSIGQLTNLEVLDLSKNHLTGLIPNSIGQLKKLKVLDLSHNQFTAMPSSIFNLKKTLIVNLRRNKISHVIQQEESQPTMKLKTIQIGVGGEDTIGIINLLIYLNDIRQNIRLRQGRYPIVVDFSQVQDTQLKEFEELNLSLGMDFLLTRPTARNACIPSSSYSEAIKEVLTIIQRG